MWLPVYPGDGPDDWDEDLLQDRRVTHLWDDDLVISRWFARNAVRIGIPFEDRTFVWDAYMVFDEDATWTALPSTPAGSGATVIADRDGLESSLDRLL